ncbi:MAG: hypothetical protein K0U70_02415 [Actinomycetia bacterium]|nr:hypothetical protein [Actinomycetes bacterium]MCH9710068.1 hypothetical protein [Actinomycetes bacterium]MCH9766633.1 hypothetical protein [Actinomycetes bacterium]
MTGPHSIPLQIPSQVPLQVPFAPSYIPPEIDMEQVIADVADDGVSVPPAAQGDVPALRQVVEQAQSEGVDLKIVVIELNPPTEMPLRDIATEVGAANPGATVLAMSPSFAGTYSPVFDRVTLEAGQDLAKTGNSVQSSQNFLGELTTSHFPWTPFTIVLVLAVAVAAVSVRLLQVIGKRAEVPDTALSSSD